MLSQWFSKQHQKSSFTFQRDTTQKNHPLTKCMLRCLPAQELEPVPHTASGWKRGLHPPGTDCHRHLHWQMNSYRAHSLPRKYMEIQHQILTNSLKHCLMTSTRIQFPWERKFRKLTLVETAAFFKFLHCERKKLRFLDKISHGDYLASLCYDSFGNLWMQELHPSTKHYQQLKYSPVHNIKSSALGTWLI